jgi:aryl sulfotransferase
VRVREPTSQFLTAGEDSRRWRHVRFRSDDIVIATPQKSGTTWMQGIVASLLHWAEDDLGGVFAGTVWPEFRADTVEAMAAHAEAIDGRRSFKTHTPADCLPVAADEVVYVAVYRHGPDAFASWINHRARMRPAALARLNETSEVDGCVPWPVYDGDIAALFAEWQRDCNPVRHLDSWWPLRHQPNVLYVHYADLSADLDGEMRRVAEHLPCPVPEDRWPAVVKRCTLDAMRSRAARSGELDWVFDGGADAFFYKGGHGRGAQALDDHLAARYAQMTSTLPTDAATWLAAGTHATGIQPDQP